MRTYLTLITPASFYVQLDINYRGGKEFSQSSIRDHWEGL